MPEPTEDPIARIRRESPHFHTSEKGCVWRRAKLPRKEGEPLPGKKVEKIKGAFCETHQVELCRCGWTFDGYWEACGRFWRREGA